jgi:hypothetical protein
MNNPAEWSTYRTRFLVRARQLTEPLVFADALGREHRGLPGDYLVESCDGSRRITPRNIFEDVYVPMPSPASWHPIRSHRARESAPPESAISRISSRLSS